MTSSNLPKVKASATSGWQRAAGMRRGPLVRIFVDGEPVDAHERESLGVALALSGRLALRDSPVGKTPRGLFCLMGVCQECVVHVDGAAVASCMEPVRPDMHVTLDKLARDVAAADSATSERS